MKKIIFPCTARPHKARQKILLEELSKNFEVSVWEPSFKQGNNLATYSLMCGVEFNNFLAQKNFDFALIRADRLELLPISALCAYRQIPIVHIEGGADSGQRIIDSKVRHAITQLADIHLVTDEQAKRKVISLGANPDDVHNVGSLDVSFAKSIKPKRLMKEDYILFLHHAIPGEDTQLVFDAVKDLGYKIVGVKSNQDYEKSLMHEEYSPEDFISLLYYAKCVVGNSSAACKEASILGTPVVLTGQRQNGRVAGHNVIRVPHDKKEIVQAVKYQTYHNRYKPDNVYYQKDTIDKIVKILKNENDKSFDLRSECDHCNIIGKL